MSVTGVRGNQRASTFFGSFRGELVYVLVTEGFLAGAIWKTWFSPWQTAMSLACGLSLVVLLLWARHKDTEGHYELVGKTAFAVFLLDTVLTLIRLK
jgi:hypothetical protein